MKHIFDAFFNKCSEKNKKLIEQFKEDILFNRNFLDNSVCSKYDSETYPAFNNSNLYQCVFNELNFNITFSLLNKKITFSTNSYFKEEYSFLTAFSFFIEQDLYSVKFNLHKDFNLRNQLIVSYAIQNDILEVLKLEDRLNMESEIISYIAPNTDMNYGCLYIFDRQDIIKFILDNYLEPQEFKDLIMLNYDMNIEEDELLTAIYTNASLLKSSNLLVQKIKNK